MSKEGKPGQKDGALRKPNLPTFLQLYKEYIESPSPAYSAILPFPQGENEINFNPCAILNPDGQVEYWARFEPGDPDAENSVIRNITKRRGTYTVFDEIDMAQDPHHSSISEEILALGAIRIDCKDPSKPRKVTDYHEELFPIRNGEVDRSTSVVGRPGEKDVRFANLGNGNFFAVRRERLEKDNGENDYEIVDSYIQAMVLPSPQRINDIARMINIVREDSSSRIDLVEKNKDLWIGPNFPFGLVSPDGNIHVGLFSHIGRYNRYKRCQNGEIPRQYVTLASQHVFSPETGRIIRSERAKIVSTASDFEKFEIAPKKEGLEDVVFMGSPIFVVGDNPIPDYVILAEGVKDGASGITVIRYPFTLPPDPILNKDYIMPKDQAKKYLHSLEQPS